MILNRLRGLESQLKRRGHFVTTCAHCWEATHTDEWHETWFAGEENKLYSLHPLCEKCWDCLSYYARLEYYAAMYRFWKKTYGETPPHFGIETWTELWQAIERAVLCESYGRDLEAL